MKTPHRGVILPAVLFILLLVGLLAAMFAFRVNADLAGTRATAARAQTRLAAEAGVEAAKLVLATSPLDIDAWYHNPDVFHRIVVWASKGDSTIWGTNNEDLDDDVMVYRFSLLADDPTDDEDFVRFGLTDESSRLNLNGATQEQLMILVQAAVGDDPQIDPQQIVDAILDWRDPDSSPRNEIAPAEADYYRSLDRPYRIKNGMFDTIEELLLVRGVTDQILFGEDYDRNGLLTPNEDDGDASFPMDNQDNVLNRGLYPYLTVMSYEDNVSNERRPRVYLKGPEAKVREELAEVFPENPEVVDAVLAAVRAGAGGKPGGGPPGGPGGPQGPIAPPTGQPGDPTGNTGSEGQLPSGEGEFIPDDSTGNATEDGGGKETTRQQRREPGSDPSEVDGLQAGSADEEGDPSSGNPGQPGAESNDGAQPPQPMRSPASLLRPQVVDGVEQPSPIGMEHLATLLDRTTLIPSQERRVSGLVNINTAPRLVLRCLGLLTEEQISRIIEVRSGLSAEAKATPAWLLTEGVLDFDTFDQIAHRLTARGQQFTVEALGYADHLGMVTRLQVVLDMIGPIPQTIYYRDITYLGARYPIREEHLERLRARH